MASVKLKHTSGNGTILHSPAANPSSDVTLKLPSTTGTAGQVLKIASANHSSTNAELEFAADAGGKILQVVGASTTTQAFHTGDGNYDETGLSAAITPASGTKILVIVSQQVYIAKLNTTGDSHINVRLLRDSTQLAFTQVGRSIHQSSAGWVECRDSISWNYLDTHGANGSTAITYKTQYGSDMTAEVYVQRNSCTSTITLMEIGS